MIRLAMLVLTVATSVTLALAQTAVPVRLYVFDGGILESDPGRYRRRPGGPHSTASTSKSSARGDGSNAPFQDIKNRRDLLYRT